ncbi:MAG: hypothetical protein JF887_01215 [Candidatus Dormibacteraeota bacterium]|uniref:Uncharacterized protein n=1 Tax=Candidatus Amunia macphersoniae TaxID=3127014 RepID=A0A934KAS5_9BACT|nr:hypothetical protein [Candidatus Dormibacteraeota bacterium]
MPPSSPGPTGSPFPDSDVSADANLIGRAVREMWQRRIADVRERGARSRIRRQVAAVDALVTLLEERNLSGNRIFDRPLRQRVHQLQEEIGLPLPRNVVRARNTVRLHAALLDWQESLLDLLIPQRAHLPDAHDSNGDEATPAS